jgi:bifunctional ADP-heptose synthase (sugar kinase/adenylyltransferase)
VNLVQRLLGKIREEDRTIVFIGDEMLDIWKHGRTDGCQDGCIKITIEENYTRLGGMANARNSIRHWNTCTLSHGLGAHRVVKTRFVDQCGSMLFRCDMEANGMPHEIKEAHTAALKSIDQASAVLLSDYDKGLLTPEFVQAVSRKCADREIPCVADAKCHPSVYAGCVLKANNDYRVKYRECSISAHLGAVFTHGDRLPVIAITGKMKMSEIPQSLLCRPEVRCVNHVGAGDCFAAHMTMALAYGFNLREAAILAHSAGRVYVQHPHNRPPFPSEIEEDLYNIGVEV